MGGVDTNEEWTGASFDPRSFRLLSILNDDDPADDGADYCVRHDQRMQQVVPVVHHAGALYTTADGFACYTCGMCLSELFTAAVRANRVPPNGDNPGTDDILRSLISRESDRWDGGNTPDDWFQHVREEHRKDVDPDSRHIWLAATREDAHELVADDRDDTDEDVHRTRRDGGDTE